MGAVFGFVTGGGRALSPADLQGMCDTLAHHGRDAAGVRHEVLPAGSCGMGYRLCRFTAEDAFEQQPLVSPDRQQVLVWDGRLDNRDSLIEALDIEVPDICPDSRIALSAYRRWGDAGVDRLIGAFAFALLDYDKQSLLLARSPVSAPSLFHATSCGRFAFATMPSALFCLPGVARAIHERKLADMLMYSPADPQDTCFAGIQRLATGTVLRVCIDSPDHARQTKFWDPAIDHTLHYRDDAEYLETFRCMTDDVVRAQLRTTGEVGILLSGGLDSSAVAATAALQLPRARSPGRLKAYTARWAPKITPRRANQYHDETEFVEALAGRHPNLDVAWIDTPRQNFLSDIDVSFFFFERYFSNTSNRAWIETGFARARQDGVSVLLSGAQGNLAFSRDGRGLLAESWQREKWLGSIRTALRLSRPDRWRLLAAEALTCAPQSMQAATRTLMQALFRRRSLRMPGIDMTTLVRHSAIHPDFARHHCVTARYQAADIEVSLAGLSPHLAHRRRLLTHLQLQDTGVFDSGWRARYGIDSRAPLTDRRLIEFCLSLPESQATHRGLARALPRRALADRVPAEILTNRRRGQQGADWFDRLTGMRAQLAEELDRLEQHDLARRALDLPRMREMVFHWPQPGAAIETIMPYYSVLQFGMVVGRFLGWFDGSRP